MARRDPDIHKKARHAPVKNTAAADRPKEKLPNRVKKAVEPSKGKHSKSKQPKKPKKPKKNPPK